MISWKEDKNQNHNEMSFQLELLYVLFLPPFMIFVLNYMLYGVSKVTLIFLVFEFPWCIFNSQVFYLGVSLTHNLIQPSLLCDLLKKISIRYKKKKLELASILIQLAKLLLAM